MPPGSAGMSDGVQESGRSFRSGLQQQATRTDAASDVSSSDELRAAADRVTELYRATALGLIRLAYVILGDQHAAEDVVQEAFGNLFRRWDRLPQIDGLEYYVRASVVNACRSVLRRRAVRQRRVLYELPAPSAEAAVFAGVERDDLIRAVDLLPARQRETLVLRYYLDLPDSEIARLMGVSPSTVRSAAHRALHTLARTLKEL
jgi:RNA polymerase sigma-70 factor (sigma-E family)